MEIEDWYLRWRWNWRWRSQMKVKMKLKIQDDNRTWRSERKINAEDEHWMWQWEIRMTMKIEDKSRRWRSTLKMMKKYLMKMMIEDECGGLRWRWMSQMKRVRNDQDAHQDLRWKWIWKLRMKVEDEDRGSRYEMKIGDEYRRWSSKMKMKMMLNM